MSNNNLPTRKITGSTYIVNDRWLKVRADTFTTADGQTSEPWYVLEYPDWINCLVIDTDDTVLLLRHYRHGVQAHVQELIGGTVDAEDASPMANAAKELREELGYEGGELYQTGCAYPNPSNQPNTVYSFLAVGGTCSAKAVDELWAYFEVEKVPFKQFVAHVTDPKNATLYQSMHLAGIFFALNFIRSADVDSEAIARLRTMLKELQY